MTKSTAKKEARVIDKAGLAEVATWADEVRREANKVSPPTGRAATRDGALQKTLWRLRNRKTDVIREDTLLTLARYVDEHGERRLGELLYRSVVSPRALAFVAAHNAWAIERLERFYRRRGPGFVPTKEGIRPVTEDAASYYRREFERHDVSALAPIVEGWHAAMTLMAGEPVGDAEWIRRYQFAELVSEAYGTAAQPGPCRDLIDDFGRWVEAAGFVEPWRGWLHLHRILEPLLESAEAAFIPRAYWELTAAEVRRFVQLGIEREKMLLRSHPTAFQRAQALDTDSVSELKVAFGRAERAATPRKKKRAPARKRGVTPR